MNNIQIMNKMKSEMVEKAYNLGYEYEKNYHGCAQSSFAAIQDTMNWRNVCDDVVFKSATGLAGGIGLTNGSACGALTGGVLALGLKVGRDRRYFEDPEKIRYKTFKLAKKLYEKFEQEYGGCNCIDIQKKIFGRSFNMWDPKEKEEFEKAGGHEDKCPDVVGKAARWTIEILLEEK
jgi:C_GCAxxG_C_C family probable redox protein